MNGREWLARAALWFLPPPERSEPVDTALEVSVGSKVVFLRELASLAWYGSRYRAAAIAKIGLRRVLADGLCQGAVWVCMFELADLLAHRINGSRGPLESLTPALLLGLVLVLALVGLDRLAGLAGVGWLVSWLPILAMYRSTVGLAPLLVPLVGFVVLLLVPRQRALDPHRLGWLAVPLLLAMTVGPGARAAVPFWFLVVVLVGAGAVLLLPTDPRPAIAAALPISYVGVADLDRASLVAVLFGLAAPVVLAVAVLVHHQRPDVEPLSG